MMYKTFMYVETNVKCIQIAAMHRNRAKHTPVIVAISTVYVPATSLRSIKKEG